MFPNGDYEYEVRQGATPTIGDTIRRRGGLWSVASITPDTVATLHLEPVDAPALTSVYAVPSIESNIVRAPEE